VIIAFPQLQPAMPQLSSSTHFRPAFRITAVATILTLLGTGCTSVAPSRTARGAGIGAATGAVAGSVVGPSVGIDSGTAALGAMAAGALVGGVVGMVQDARERSEQEQLAMERATMAENARRREAAAREQSILEEELEIAQGFRITDIELEAARRRAEESGATLAALMEERSAAQARKKELDDLEQTNLSNLAEIEELEAQIRRLKGEEGLRSVPPQLPTAAPAPSGGGTSAPFPSGTAAPVRPGI
jgi:hypothetical protein